MFTFRRVKQKDPEAQQFQYNVEQTFLEINREIFIAGKLFTVTRPNSDSFEIPTGFQTPVRGFVVADTNVNSTFYRIETVRDKTICTIKPSAAGTYSFWIY